MERKVLPLTDEEKLDYCNMHFDNHGRLTGDENALRYKEDIYRTLKTFKLYGKFTGSSLSYERIEKLQSAGLQFHENRGENSLDQIFSGQVWCATGSFEHFNPRSLALAEIEKRGGRTTSSVTGKTTHLLLGKGGGSKRQTAEKLGVKLVSEEEFLGMISKGEVITESGHDENGQLSLF